MLSEEARQWKISTCMYSNRSRGGVGACRGSVSYIYCNFCQAEEYCSIYRALCYKGVRYIEFHCTLTFFVLL